MGKKESQGVIYFALGDLYIQQFKRSFHSLMDHMPESSVSLITNNHVDIPGVNVIIDDFKVTEDRKKNLLNKVRAFQLSPYEQTIYLDTDTFILDSISELYNLLDYFDFCAAHGPMDYSYPRRNGITLTGFLPYNTGVVAYSSNRTCTNTIRDWHDIFDEKIRLNPSIQENDQTSFCEAVLENRAYVCTLPNNYNLRSNWPGNLCRKKVKIVHDHHIDEEFLRQVNHSSDVRIVSKRKFTFT